MEAQHPVTKTISLRLLTLAVFFGCISLWLVMGAAIFTTFDNWDDRGKVGDMFGAANALFSALALAGITIAFLLQWKQLRLQQDGVAEASKVQKETTTLLVEQVAALSLSSKLMSLSTLINIYEHRLEAARTSLAKDLSREAEYGSKIEEYTRQLQELLERALAD